METDRRQFLKLLHETMDHPSFLSLSPGAARVYWDFLRGWDKVTWGGKKLPVAGMSFTWASHCAWAAQEASWRGYRTELENAGFLRLVNRKAGRFEPSEDWRTQAPVATKVEKLARVERSRDKRRAKNADRVAVFEARMDRKPTHACSENRCTNRDSCSEICGDPQIVRSIRSSRSSGDEDLSDERDQEDRSPETAENRALRLIAAGTPAEASAAVCEVLGIDGPPADRIAASAFGNPGFRFEYAAAALRTLATERPGTPEVTSEQWAARFVHRSTCRPELWFQGKGHQCSEPVTQAPARPVAAVSAPRRGADPSEPTSTPLEAMDRPNDRKGRKRLRTIGDHLEDLASKEEMRALFSSLAAQRPGGG